MLDVMMLDVMSLEMLGLWETPKGRYKHAMELV